MKDEQRLSGKLELFVDDRGLLGRVAVRGPGEVVQYVERVLMDQGDSATLLAIQLSALLHDWEEIDVARIKARTTSSITELEGRGAKALAAATRARSPSSGTTKERGDEE